MVPSCAGPAARHARFKKQGLRAAREGGRFRPLQGCRFRTPHGCRFRILHICRFRILRGSVATKPRAHGEIPSRTTAGTCGRRGPAARCGSVRAFGKRLQNRACRRRGRGSEPFGAVRNLSESFGALRPLRKEGRQRAVPGPEAAERMPGRGEKRRRSEGTPQEKEGARNGHIPCACAFGQIIPRRSGRRRGRLRPLWRGPRIPWRELRIP